MHRNNEQSTLWVGPGEQSRHARDYEIELTHHIARSGLRVRTIDFESAGTPEDLFEEAIAKIAGSDSVVAEMSGHNPDTVSVASRASIMRKPVLALFAPSHRFAHLPPMVEGDPNVLPFEYERSAQGVVLAKLALNQFFEDVADGAPFSAGGKGEFRGRVERRRRFISTRP